MQSESVSVEQVNVRIKLLDKKAIIPQYKSELAAGADLHSVEEVFLDPHETKLVKTGIAIEIPVGFEVQIRPRSGLAKKGITVANAPGTIDADYRGEIGVLLTNLNSTATEKLKVGTRIAQMVVCPVKQAKFTLVESLTDTKRGSGGFGSTGA